MKTFNFAKKNLKSSKCGWYCLLDEFSTSVQEDIMSSPPADPSTIHRLRKPVDNMIERHALENIRYKLSNKMLVFLQCYGVPGSGKSEIIRKLAEEFPFGSDSKDGNKLLIKWHIQCKDSDHNLQKELKGLTEKLLQHSFLRSQDTYQDIVECLDDDEAGKLVNHLVDDVNVPVLIVIEDAPTKNLTLLKSLCENLKQHHDERKSLSTKVHVYLSSRKNFNLLETKYRDPFYMMEKVNGFDEEESIEFLKKGMSEDEDEHSSILNIYQRFSGLPLGLIAAKEHCKKARITYSDYLSLVKDVDYDIISKERKAVTDEYGRSAKHIFQAIVVPFMPSDDDACAAILHRKILCCLSWFNYDRIPQYVLHQCCHLLRDGKVQNPYMKNKVEVGTLITDLLDHSMCTETDEGEITFHEVVLNAFRFNRNFSSFTTINFNPLILALEIMCSLASKDLRKKDIASKMYKLRRHMQVLLDHIDNNQNMFKDQQDELLLRALTSHLHEIAGAIMLNESPSFWKESETHFKKALQDLLPEDVGDYAELASDIQNVNEIAHKIVEMSRLKGSELPPGFTTNYVSKLKLYCDDEEELKFLKSRSKQRSGFAALEKMLAEKESSVILVQKLKECGLFLSDDKYRPVFYAERIAFILHSWSRLVLYGDPEAVKEIGERCLRMSEVSHEISIQSRNSCKVPLLSERLSITGGRIPILLKLKESPNVLKSALEFCEKALNNEANDKVFENGMLKGPFRNDTRITLLRFVVRINARLHKGNSSDVVKVADERCQQLLKLSEKHVESFCKCLMCFVYCAKYYAAKQDLAEAIKCFDKFFEWESKCDVRFNVRCWAVYNYARAVSELNDSPSKYLQAAIEKCENVLCQRNPMNKSLRERLISSFNAVKQDLQAVQIRKREPEPEIDYRRRSSIPEKRIRTH